VKHLCWLAFQDPNAFFLVQTPGNPDNKRQVIFGGARRVAVADGVANQLADRIPPHKHSKRWLRQPVERKRRLSHKPALI